MPTKNNAKTVNKKRKNESINIAQTKRFKSKHDDDDDLALNMTELEILSRTQLQQLAKQHGIKANLKSVALISQLSSLSSQSHQESNNRPGNYDFGDRKRSTLKPTEMKSLHELDELRQYNNDLDYIQGPRAHLLSPAQHSPVQLWDALVTLSLSFSLSFVDINSLFLLP